MNAIPRRPRTSIPLATLLLVAALAAPARAQEIQQLAAPGLTLDLVRIPAGTFTIGSPADEPGHKPDETQAERQIKSDFFLGKTPVTRGQFAAFVAAARYRTEAETGTSGGYGVVDGGLVQRKDFTWKSPGFPQTDDHPVVLVTVKDAQAFCDWLGQRTGRKVSLPTEAQWEYACRAGTATRFYSGPRDADGESVAWVKSNAAGTTHPVGDKPANPWGLLDMSGNVLEWCSDTYGPYTPGGDVVGDLRQARNVLRGGSFLRALNDARSAARYRNAPASRNADNGFRVAVALAAPLAPTGATALPQNPPLEVPAAPRPEDSPRAAAPAQGPAVSDAVGVAAPGMAVEGSSLFHGFVGLACMAAPCLAVLAIAIVIIRAVSRNRSNPSAAAGPGPSFGGGPVPSGPAPRVTQDGFWVDTGRYQPGQRVRYRYQGPGGWVEDEFVVEPGGQGQFIYTGISPADVLLMGLANQMQQHAWQQTQRPPSTPPPIPPRPTSRPSRHDHDNFSGFPSAY
jgi:formylglycine-generating enzyme required for sulfatase activity